MSAKRILIIDDEPDFSEVLRKRISFMGEYEVAIAKDGKEGIKKAKENKPDLIFLDIMMPGIDGFEVLKRLKKDIKTISIPVVMLTALTDDESKIKASQLYDEAYMSKPTEAEALQAVIDKIFHIRGKD